MAHSALFEHVKLKKLCKALGIPKPHAVGHLEFLAHYVSQHNVTGDISNLSDDEIELAAEWTGEPGKFTAAAIGCRFVDRDASGTRLHDWPQWAPEWVKKRLARLTTADNGGQRQPVDDNGALEKRREEKSINMNKKESTPPCSPRSGVSTFSIDGSNRAWVGISDTDWEAWAKAFPAVSLKTEAARALEWCLSNPAKTKKNYRRFLVNWFSRSQERGGGQKSSRHVCRVPTKEEFLAGGAG